MNASTDRIDGLDIEDLGDAAVETRQVWFGTQPDSMFGLGFIRDTRA